MQLSFEYDQTYLPAFPVLELTIAGTLTNQQQTVQGLIDSGSDATQIPAHILDLVGAREVDERWVRDLSGIRYPVTIYMTQLAIGPLLLLGMEVIGRKEISEVIIGRDVLNQLIVTLNGLAYITEVSD
ncbi:MAG: retroviral-like aspartic protease family protein [Chloroflexi bacterium]|nr:retroviral-like aspartic protease family protein [Chloroflexota bacterium]MCI0649670.1 retroviral-like aspartic protease family protein [Chloroflexota bacterium]MCI0731224.1 retroviral-like aspartic protease family protein [Chloroflexota bacterium]